MSKFFELLSNIITKLNRSVSIDSQDLTDEEKAQVRANIGAGTGDGTGGGVSSWNDLTDKPFGETGTKIEWDGTPTDEYVDDLKDAIGMTFYKVSDITEIDAISGGTVFLKVDDEEFSCLVDETTIVYLNEYFVLILDSSGQPFAGLSTKAGPVDLSPLDLPMTFNVPSGGLWFLYASDSMRTIAITLSDYEVKQIDEKFIPFKEVDLSNYYTKDQVYTKNDVYSMYDTYSSSQVDYKLQEIRDLIGNCSAVINSIDTLVGGDTE